MVFLFDGWLKTIVVATIALAALCTLAISAAGAEESSSVIPWWKQEKIRFFWGQWQHNPVAGVPMRQVLEHLSRVGATVFVTSHFRTDRDEDKGFDLDEAQIAREYGIRYFAGIFGSYLYERAAKMDAPRAVAATGEYQHGYGRYANIPAPCPLYEPLYREHLLKPMLEAAATGLVDGVHLDWEPYERPEAGVCYCDDCFSQFLSRKHLQVKEEVPKTQRYQWLEKRGLVDDYEQVFAERRTEMFREFARRIHQVKPDFVFSGYAVDDWAMRAGLHSPEVPFFVVDFRHYFEDHTRPWWQSYYAHEHDLGYIHIAGSYNITFFGYQPETNVSASQWMYDAAINTDGYWLWFEEELGPEMWRSFWEADRRIRATEQRVGDFLLHGEQDIHFVTPIEWSGDPTLADNIIQRTYHLGDEHLVHINNVDTDRPVQVRLRFPRLPANSRWVVQDPISGLTYTHDGKRVVWTQRHLREGVLVSLEKRSELFLRLSPPQAGEQPEASAMMPAQMNTPMPPHSQATVSAPPVGTTAGPQRLVYTKTQDMGYVHSGRHSGWSLANAIYAVDSDGSNNQQLRQVKGYLWAPVWSPDGSRVAFCHYANGRGQIYVMSSDGGQATNVSANPYCDRSPVWSPDSSQIAFVSDRDGDWNIYVMEADGSGQVRLTNSPGNDQAPAWSPDGQQLAFQSDRGGDVDIYVMDADGSNQRPVVELPGDQKEPTWSPDGRRLAFVSLGWVYPNLSVVTLQTRQVKWVLHMPYIGSPRWSPDGSRLAGVFRGPWVRPGGDCAGIFIVGAQESLGQLSVGADEHKLVEASSVQPYHGGRRDPTFIPTWYSYGSASPRWVVKTFSGLCWSPDGQKLAFSSDMGEDGYFYVYTIPTNGGQATRLDETASAWPQSVSWCQR